MRFYALPSRVPIFYVHVQLFYKQPKTLHTKMRLFLLAALLLAMGIHGESKKPNIVLILIDDLGL